MHAAERRCHRAQPRTFCTTSRGHFRGVLQRRTLDSRPTRSSGEPNFLGLRRSQLLELLFLRAIGQNAITRLAIAPTYELKREELGESVKYLWYIRKELKKLVDDDMLRTGVKTSGWIVMALNEWAGLTPSKQSG